MSLYEVNAGYSLQARVGFKNTMINGKHLLAFFLGGGGGGGK